ncbi:MAG: cation transporter [Clostridia bacterium]|nr:cation transporter [Clostridia bacterium]
MKLLRKGESPADQPVRKRLGTLGSGVGVGVNALLAAGKLLIGSLTGSVAVTADAINNLSDAAGSVVSLVSMRLAQKPVDKEHPFGHGRMEYLGALAVGVMILVMGVETLLSGVRSILSPAEVAFGWVPFWLLVVSILMKGGLFLFYRAVGRLIDFPSLLAAAKDSLSDMLATSAVVVSMIVSHGFNIPIDGWMGVAVSMLVLKAGFDVVRETVDSLMGGRKNPELGREIITRMMRYEQILGTHDLLIHDYGPGRCIASIHAEVPADGNILVLHEIIDRAEHEIGEELNIPLCIHMDPIVSGDETTDAVHGKLSAFLREKDGGFMLHDLRMVPGEERTNLVFDVVIPPGFAETKQLTAEICAAAKQIDPRYECVIHYDIDYYH